jgi:hypothetical protein
LVPILEDLEIVEISRQKLETLGDQTVNLQNQEITPMALINDKTIRKQKQQIVL